MGKRAVINLGDQVKDPVSGFSGIVIAKTEYMNGCDRVCVQGKYVLKNKEIPEYHFDEPQLNVIKRKAIKLELIEEKRKTGGPAFGHSPKRN